MNVKKTRLAQGALVLLAALCLLYPLIANYYVLNNNATVVADYLKEDNTQQVDDMNTKNELINDANFYADEDPFTDTNKNTDSREQDKVVAVLTIPQLDEELAVYEKTNTSTLSKGLALLKGTHYPTGGLDHMSVITGHRGTSNAAMLKHVDRLNNGDVIWINNGVEKLYYEVYDKQVVLPTDTHLLRIIPNQDSLVLLTCDTPDLSKGLNTHRLLVFTRRVPKPDDLEMIMVVADSNYEFKILAIIALMILTITFWIWFIKRRAKD